MLQKELVDFIQSRFPGQFLISIHEFSKIVGESYGGTRNKIAQGKLEVPIVRRGERNFVAVPDVLRYLNEIWLGGQLPPTVAIVTAGEAPASPRRISGRPVKNAAAKARAALTKAVRMAKRGSTSSTAAQHASGGSSEG